MRGALPTGFFLLAFASGCWGGARSAAKPPAAPAEATAAVPAWVPALTAEQRALMAPVQRTIKVPAARVFPDLARFGYAPSRPLGNPDDAVRFTRMVTQVLNDSPRFYTLESAPAEAANLVAQYGPPAGEPDGYVVAARGESGLLDLVPAPGADEARAVLSRGDKLADPARAVALYRAALGKAGGVPALRVALAGALRQSGKVAEAEQAYREAVGVDPTFAPAHLGLAEIADERGDGAAARRALIEALAYHPASPRALELADKLAGAGPRDGGWTFAPAPAPAGQAGDRVAPLAVFLDVDDAGAVHVATAKSDAAQIYGGCRAIMRHEPDVRAQLFQQPVETPYFLTVAEEVICLEAAIGAHYAATSGGARPAREMSALTRLARAEGLSGYVMFEILGRHRPERARAAPPDVHRDIAVYVERHVLGRAPAPPDGVFALSR